MDIRMMGYSSRLANSMQQLPDSIFQDGNQRLVYAICDIQETDDSYVVGFKPACRNLSK